MSITYYNVIEREKSCVQKIMSDVGKERRGIYILPIEVLPRFEMYTGIRPKETNGRIKQDIVFFITLDLKNVKDVYSSCGKKRQIVVFASVKEQEVFERIFKEEQIFTLYNF